MKHTCNYLRYPYPRIWYDSQSSFSDNKGRKRNISIFLLMSCILFIAQIVEGQTCSTNCPGTLIMGTPTGSGSGVGSNCSGIFSFGNNPYYDGDAITGRDTFVACPSDCNTEISKIFFSRFDICLLYTSPSPRDATLSRMPSSA